MIKFFNFAIDALRADVCLGSNGSVAGGDDASSAADSGGGSAWPGAGVVARVEQSVGAESRRTRASASCCSTSLLHFRLLFLHYHHHHRSWPHLAKWGGGSGSPLRPPPDPLAPWQGLAGRSLPSRSLLFRASSESPPILSSSTPDFIK